MTAVLLLTCPDQRGIVAATMQFIADHDGNVLHAEQHADGEMFFQRVEFELDGLGLSRDEIEAAFAPVAERFGIIVRLEFTDVPIATALMASKQPHCLYDMLTRWKSGELPMDLRVVISNHPDHVDIAEHMGVPYVHAPVTKDTKPPNAQSRYVFTEGGAELYAEPNAMILYKTIGALPSRAA